MKWLFLLLVSPMAFSFTLGTGVVNSVPTPTIKEGVYVTEGETPYKAGTLNFSEWADSALMKTILERDGREYEVEVYLDPVDKNIFRGEGLIIVRYPDGKGCKHRFAARVYAYEDKVYLEENTPKAIPYNPNGPCTGASQYVWVRHPKPYVLKAE